MSCSRFATWFGPVGILVIGVNIAAAQGYPAKPIRIVVSDVGGGNDFAARMITPGLIANLGQQVRPGTPQLLGERGFRHRAAGRELEGDDQRLEVAVGAVGQARFGGADS